MEFCPKGDLKDAVEHGHRSFNEEKARGKFGIAYYIRVNCRFVLGYIKYAKQFFFYTSEMSFTGT